MKLVQYNHLPFQFPSLPTKGQRTDNSFHYQLEKKAILRHKFPLVVFCIKIIDISSVWSQQVLQKKDPKTPLNFIFNNRKNEMRGAQKDISSSSSSDVVTVIIAHPEAHWSAWTASTPQLYWPESDHWWRQARPQCRQKATSVIIQLWLPAKVHQDWIMLFLPLKLCNSLGSKHQSRKLLICASVACPIASVILYTVRPGPLFPPL